MKRDGVRRLFSFCTSLFLCMSLFVLRLQNGQLCWYDGERGQWNDTRCCVDALTEQERFRLKGGLTFSTRAALTQALEDYGDS